MMAGDLCWHSGMRCFGLLGIGSEHVTYVIPLNTAFIRILKDEICGGFPLIHGSGSLNTGL